MIILEQVQINTAFSILLIILLGHAYFNTNRRKITNKLFLWIIGLTCFILNLETASVLLNDANFKQFIVLHKMVDMLGFILAPIILYLGYIFSKEWVNRYQKEKIKTNYILLLPLFINGIATLISYNGSGLFYITNNNIYQRGNLFYILPCVCYIYFIYNLYFLYKQRKKLNDSELIIFSLFYIVPAIFTIIQLRYSVYLTTWNSAAMVTVVTYVFILNDQSHRDSLTGLENRLSYEHYAENIDYKKHNKLFMVYIDIDKFKAINDLYGHCEGDEALKAFADLMVKSFLPIKKKLIRLGGDEFLILFEETKPEKVVNYIENLIQHMEEYNNLEGRPYRLKFSYGMACYTDNYKSLNELLDKADQLMYEKKQNRKK